MPGKAKPPIFFLFAFLSCFFFSSFSSQFGTIHYLIDSSSYLSIEGTSNITAFECRCNQAFPPGSLALNISENGKKTTFQNGKLTIETRLFDCGQKGINKDMHKALKADTYPNIRIDLLEISQDKTFFDTKNKERIPIKAKANLTIADCTQMVYLDVKAMELDSGLYRFECSEDLKMSSFNIDPPKPLMGLIKVDDEIRINFNLVVALLDV